MSDERTLILERGREAKMILETATMKEFFARSERSFLESMSNSNMPMPHDTYIAIHAAYLEMLRTKANLDDHVQQAEALIIKERMEDQRKPSLASV